MQKVGYQYRLEAPIVCPSAGVRKDSGGQKDIKVEQEFEG